MYGGQQGLPASDTDSFFQLRTSDFGLRISDSGFRTSDFRFPTSDFRLPTFAILGCGVAKNIEMDEEVR